MGNKQHIDELLDAALAGTFPASDPVSALHATRVPPGQKGEEKADEQDAGDEGATAGAPPRG
jgi:hypothetical protein